jgi:hypothetical protein
MKRSVSLIAALWLVAESLRLSVSAAAPLGYFKVHTIDPGLEWRFRPLVVDLNRDEHPDLVATARLPDNPLRMWLGDGRGNLTAVTPTWTDTGYAALAAGDINRDGFPDLVSAGHFGGVQTLISDRKGGFTEKILRPGDGWVGAELADLNGDGLLDLFVLGYQKAGLEIYYGDGSGNWRLHKTLPEPRPGQIMPGRDVLVGDVNHDGHVDVIVAFQRWGLYIYYGDGRGGLTGGPATFRQPQQASESLALADVNNDGHLDLAVNGNLPGRDQANGPDVYLSDGRGGWTASSVGLKIMKYVSAGIAFTDLNGDGNRDLIAGGNTTGTIGDGYGLFWFAGDGKGGWQLAEESGLPTTGLPVIHGVTVADLDHDKALEIIALGGGRDGEITIWKRR